MVSLFIQLSGDVYFPIS